MDEIVYTREALKRQLVAAISTLEAAADKYDPEKDCPAEDLIAAFGVAALQKCVSEYAEAVAHRITSRAEERKAAGS